MTRTRCALLALGMLAVLVPALPARAVDITSIAAIVDHRDEYANRDVTVVGTVTEERFGYLGESFYTLRGDERRINVVSPRPAPAPGERLEVTAKVGRKPPDAEFDFPPVLIEKARQPAR